MVTPLNRRIPFALIAVITMCFSKAAFSYSRQDGYQSPYKVNFTIPMEQLCEMDDSAPRDNPKLESETPHDEWYSRRIRRKYGAWGPEPRHYSPIPHFDERSVTWKRERVLAVAVRMIGLPYQHHHIPDWDPPRDWPWKPVKYGRNSKGIDCSDFTSWLYNYGLGMKLKTAIGKQAEDTQVPHPGGGYIQVRTIRDDHGYDALIRELKTGDLLYIKNDGGKLAHVIMWVGSCGWSPDGSPLVIDSTGSGHRDSNGVDIPIGIYLRPFLKDSWYYKSFSHAHRLIRDEG